MVRIDAQPNAAEVVDVITLRARSLGLSVKFMECETATATPVPGLVCLPEPDPAARFLIFPDHIRVVGAMLMTLEIVPALASNESFVRVLALHDRSSCATSALT